MSYFNEIYQKRLGRYGDSPQERLEQGRRINFNKFLNQSPHYVKFIYNKDLYNEREVEGVLEPFRQDQTKTLMHLLCRVDEVFNAGDIVTIKNYRYMFYYWDERQDSGYNRWALIKLNHEIEWLNEDGSVHQSEAYIYSQEDNMLKNELRSRSRSATLYLENLKLDFMVMPATKELKMNSYLEITVGDLTRSERVTGFDFLSTPGIMYVSMDPTLKRDLTPVREQKSEDNPDDFFWFGGN